MSGLAAGTGRVGGTIFDPELSIGFVCESTTTALDGAEATDDHFTFTALTVNVYFTFDVSPAI